MAKPLGLSVIVEAPKFEQRAARHTIGVRKRIPSKTLGSTISKILQQTRASLAAQGLAVSGPPFFRFHCINMGVEFDLEAGYISSEKIPGGGELLSNELPAGNYVSLKYAGKNRGYQGNKALIEWARGNGYEFDRWDTDLGDTFACRYEVYLTDIESEPDSKKWVKEVAIKTR